MKKLLKKTILILAIVLFAVPAVFADAVTHEFAVLSTTDMHGRATAKDVATGAEVPNSMLRVSSAVEGVRDEFGDDIVLIDNGDTIQGNLSAQYAINYRTDELNPMVEELIDIGYDAWVMGNHEFNFLPSMRDKQVLYAADAGLDVISANITLKEDGVDVFGNERSAGESFYKPYTVKTIEFDDGLSVKVAIIGLSNAANHTWDLETNYPNLSFSSLDNPDGLLENEINKWTAIVKETENPDIIIVAAHSGMGTDDGISGSFLLEGQVLTGAMNSSGADLIIYGHDHTANIATVENKEGKAIDLVNGGGDNLTKSVFTLTFEDGTLTDYSVASSLLPLSEYQDDADLSAKVERWYTDAYEWASSPLGTFSGGWNDYVTETEGKSNDDLVLTQTKLMDFIHKAQIWSTWQSYESEGIEGATVSICSAVFGYDRDTGAITFTPHDGETISTLELSLLYRYSNNLLCAIEMTGEQLYAWMSTVADMLTVTDGVLGFEGSSIYGVDTFYGVDYTFDATKEKGQRVVSATINGEDIRNIDSIRVAVNSYRLSGGYGFFEATGLSESDAFWSASEYLGSDRAPVPTQIGEYVAAMKTVTPNDSVSHGYDSSWQIIY